MHNPYVCTNNKSLLSRVNLPITFQYLTPFWLQLRVDYGQGKMENHVKTPTFSIMTKIRREDTIEVNCRQYRVQYINPSMSVDDRHEMFQEIIETKEINQK